jgi:NAD(P)-dependent dehydrogenase (short-subunit alcohol dehydrogenase family)
MASRVLDPTILFSFDRTGFRRHALAFEPTDLEVDLTGRTCLVTGANSGIGFETSLALARRGATVWMLCRNRERGEDAARAVREQAETRKAHLAVVDMSDCSSIRRFVREFEPKVVDVLVHNAGVLPDERIESPDRVELTFATHVLGPYLLTQALLPRLRRSDDARVVFVSSGGMYTQRLSLEDWRWREREYDGVAAYAMTKRMQVVLAELMAQDLAPDEISVNSMHPGWADTPAVRSSLPRFHSTMKKVLRSPVEGADTVVWLAASPAPRGRTGLFWFDREPQTTYLLPWTRESDSDRRSLLSLLRRMTATRRH